MSNFPFVVRPFLEFAGLPREKNYRLGACIQSTYRRSVNPISQQMIRIWTQRPRSTVYAAHLTTTSSATAGGTELQYEFKC